MITEWPQERIERLTELWAEGLSYPQIAKRLGVSANAVTGKVWRLGYRRCEPRLRPAPDHVVDCAEAPCLFLQRLGIEILEITPPKPTMARIAKRIAAARQVKIEELISPMRERRVAWPRQEAMAAMYDTGRWSYPQIGRYLGGRDHTTVLHGVREHKKRLAEMGEGA